MCNTVLIPEIPHYVRDDGVFIDVCPKRAMLERRSDLLLIETQTDFNISLSFQN
ncbi:hypothetical protein BN59_02772 [Legionella massiliensis]|uniref:Uncharacterized protein n=1 Tax=Legionella massiliensis TaxID=1034943 RepID=A0A078KZR0_9GAMM|nr:hypothetical protein BN59_02772 [Legionella massiliensis]CEE14200.1 hypothetical protein BN1094_02772 [Legionella massiliensis]